MTFHKKQTMTTKKEYLIYKLSDDMKGCIKIDAELFGLFPDVKNVPE